MKINEFKEEKKIITKDTKLEDTKKWFDNLVDKGVFIKDKNGRWILDELKIEENEKFLINMKNLSSREKELEESKKWIDEMISKGIFTKDGDLSDIVKSSLEKDGKYVTEDKSHTICKII